VDGELSKLPPEVAQELMALKQQIRGRDQLVEQLSTELFRMVRAHPPALPAAIAPSHPIGAPSPEADRLRQELQTIEQQIAFYQDQIDKRDAEITRLQKNCQLLSERNQSLELIVQELPVVYRQKFADRLEQVKSKVQSLQSENQRLSHQLQQQKLLPDRHHPSR
jgi:chromosome segregation ATPase